MGQDRQSPPPEDPFLVIGGEIGLDNPVKEQQQMPSPRQPITPSGQRHSDLAASARQS